MSEEIHVNQLPPVLAIDGDSGWLAWCDGSGRIIADRIPNTEPAAVDYIMFVSSAAGGGWNVAAYVYGMSSFVLGALTALGARVTSVMPEMRERAMGGDPGSKLEESDQSAPAGAVTQQGWAGDAATVDNAEALLLLAFGMRREIERLSRNQLTTIDVITGMRLPREIMFAPGGISMICGRTLRWGASQFCVSIDRATGERISDAIRVYTASHPDYQPFGDKNHTNAEITFYAEGIEWRDAPQPGLFIVGVEWTGFGVELIRDRKFRFFSPSGLYDTKVQNWPLGTDGVLRPPKGERGSSENPAQMLGVASCIGSVVAAPAYRDIAAFIGKP